MDFFTVYRDPIARLMGSWSWEINVWSVLFRFALSFVFAMMLGWERSRKLHSAGLRTFILTMLTGTAAMLLDAYIVAAVPLISAATIVGTAIISGNTFFFSSRNQVKGLTTSVGLWASSMLGLASGGGFYTLAVVGFVALMFSLSGLPALEAALKDRSNHFAIHMELKTRESLGDFLETVRRLGLHIDEIEANPAYVGTSIYAYSAYISIAYDQLKKYKKHSEIIEALKTLDYIAFIEEIA